MLYTVFHDARTSGKGETDEKAAAYAIGQLNSRFNKHGYQFTTNGTGAYENVNILEYDNSGAWRQILRLGQGIFPYRHLPDLRYVRQRCYAEYQLLHFPFLYPGRRTFEDEQLRPRFRSPEPHPERGEIP